MPLKQSSSNKAFTGNLKAEMNDGKPQKQALAIAYSVKHKNGGKKYANGGQVGLDERRARLKEQLFGRGEEAEDQQKASDECSEMFLSDEDEMMADGGMVDRAGYQTPGDNIPSQEDDETDETGIEKSPEMKRKGRLRGILGEIHIKSMRK